MFGKRSSSNDSFVMAMGRKAGNLKRTRATPAPAGTGKKGAGGAGPMPVKQIKAAPAGTGKKPKPQIKVAAPKPQMHSGNGMKGALSLNFKKGLGVNENNPESLGKANTFILRGK